MRGDDSEPRQKFPTAALWRGVKGKFRMIFSPQGLRFCHSKSLKRIRRQVFEWLSRWSASRLKDLQKFEQHHGKRLGRRSILSLTLDWLWDYKAAGKRLPGWEGLLFRVQILRVQISACWRSKKESVEVDDGLIYGCQFFKLHWSNYGFGYLWIIFCTKKKKKTCGNTGQRFENEWNSFTSENVNKKQNGDETVQGERFSFRLLFFFPSSP